MASRQKPIALSMEKIRRIMAEVVMEIVYHKKEYVLLRHGRAVAKLVPLTKEEEAAFSTGWTQRKTYLKKYEQRKAVGE